MTETLIILNSVGTVDLVACSEKSRNKSLEQGELWVVDRHTGRVLPYRGGGGSYSGLESRGDWWEVRVGPASDGGAPTPEVTGSDGVSPARDSESPAASAETVLAGPVLSELQAVIRRRHQDMPEGSYTTHLFSKGADKIRKKTGEEAVEVILARSGAELTSEAADLIYHLMVLLESQDLGIQDVVAVLRERHASG